MCEQHNMPAEELEEVKNEMPEENETENPEEGEETEE